MLFVLTSMLDLCMLVPVFIMIYFIRNLILHLPIFSTIQKPYYRQSVDFTMAGFADALRPEKFSGVHFKRWQVKVRLWLTVMHAWEARLGIPVGEHFLRRGRSSRMPTISSWAALSMSLQIVWLMCTCT
jgi:hypothetical protein